MDKVENKNGYIIKRNVRCKHPKLRAFAKKTYYVCMTCGSECQFCIECNKVFTLNTLSKYDGICGNCSNKYGDYASPLFMLNLPLTSMLSGLLPPLNRYVPIEEETEEKPLSEYIRSPSDFSEEIEMTDEKESNEYQARGDVKSIVSEDKQKKLWLVEWENYNYATWESFDKIKDSKKFQDYIEHKMKLITD